MYKSEWTDEPVLHIFPHWNWKVGEPVDIWAYYNNADEVELYLKWKEPRRTTKNGQYLSCLLACAFHARNLESRLPAYGGKEVLVKEIHYGRRAGPFGLDTGS